MILPRPGPASDGSRGRPRVRARFGSAWFHGKNSTGNHFVRRGLFTGGSTEG